METSKYRKIVERPDLRPEPHWGSLQRFPGPPAGGERADNPLPKNPTLADTLTASGFATRDTVTAIPISFCLRCQFSDTGDSGEMPLVSFQVGTPKTDEIENICAFYINIHSIVQHSRKAYVIYRMGTLSILLGDLACRSLQLSITLLNPK